MDKRLMIQHGIYLDTPQKEIVDAMKLTTRAERRRAEKAMKKQETVYHLTAAQIDAIRQEAFQKAEAEANKQLEGLRNEMKKEAVEWSLKFFMAIPCLVMHDKFGFGRQRLDLFMSYVRTWLQACQDDDEALSDAVKAAQELGYEIEWR